MTDNTKSEKAHAANLTATPNDGVECGIDNVWVHSIPDYLKVVYPDMTVVEYEKNFHGRPLFSPKLVKAREANAAKTTSMASATLHKLPTAATTTPVSQQTFADVFELGSAKAALNAKGGPCMIDVLGDPEPEFADYIPDIDPNYIYNIDLLKQVMLGFQLGIPTYAWGMHGTGKTTIFLQYCARTRRPAMRVQHTVSTEEAHVLGQYVVKNGSTHFEPGPLAVAMRFGLVYIADEYDNALPGVVSVYQPVLEGHKLIIKEAPPAWRVVKPHKDFRFLATGNTNGGGDDTGLYQGTQVQNAANYSRFGITVEVNYMPERQEIAVIAGQGGIHQDDAKKLVELAEHVRTAYQQGDISVPISPRELIRAAQLGRVLGGAWKQGLAMAFTNRLNVVDRKTVVDVINRIFI
jgi:cobaltochelatase CobS